MIDFYLFDHELNLLQGVPDADVLNVEEEQVLNGLITAFATLRYRTEYDKAIYFGYADPENQHGFWRFKIRRKKKVDRTIEFNGIHELFDDLKFRSIIKDKRPKNMPAVEALALILEGTGWQTGNVHGANNKASTSWYYVTALNAFNDFLKKWNVEFRPRIIWQANGNQPIKFIDIYARLSEDRGKWFEYKNKLLQVVAETDTDSVATAFIGRGKGEQTAGGGFGRKIQFTDVEWSTEKGDPVNKPKGQNYVEFPEALNHYGFAGNAHRMTMLEFSDIEDPEKLLQATYEKALTLIRPQVQFKAQVLEQGLMELGEIVTIIRDDLNIRYKTRVFKIKRDIINPLRKTVEFGDQVVASVASRLSDLQVSIKEQEENTISIATQLLNSINDSYFGEDGYNYDLRVGNEYGLPAGLYSFDKPIDEDPSKVIYVGAGKLMIANSKKSDGKWDFKTVATGDGYVAENMFTNSIIADIAKINHITADMIHMGKDVSLADELTAVKDTLPKIETLSERVDDIIADDTITPLEEIDLAAKAEEIRNTAKLVLFRLDSYDSKEAKELIKSASELANFVGQPISHYAAFDAEEYKRRLQAYLSALEAAEALTRRNELERYSDFEAGQITLGNRIGKFEEQLVLEPNMITMKVSDGTGGVRKAMTLGQEELAFYSKNSKVAYFANRQMFIENATIKQQLEIGNHTMQKHGTEFTIFVFTGEQ